MEKIHKPVLLNETVDGVFVTESGNYFDGTIGFGGHATELLKRLNGGSLLIGTDKDFKAFEYCKKRFANDARVKLYHAGFSNINLIAKIEFVESFHGIYADLGVSSFQLDSPEAGFSFRADVPLDLRMNRTEGKTAADFLNEAKESEIADVIFKYGEEKNSRKIARRIVERRKRKKITTTFELREIIAELTPERFLNKTLARVFQALRIHVNNELDELKTFLGKAVDLLAPGGRLAVITFHSLEDRIVKEAFKYEELTCVCPPESPICTCDKEQRLKIITKKPITPSAEEVKNNPRARSAKLRIAERL